MNPDTLKASLKIMWQGLLAIFIVIGLIILAVQLTKFCVNKAESAKKAASDASAPHGDGEAR